MLKSLVSIPSLVRGLPRIVSFKRFNDRICLATATSDQVPCSYKPTLPSHGSNRHSQHGDGQHHYQNNRRFNTNNAGSSHLGYAAAAGFLLVSVATGQVTIPRNEQRLISSFTKHRRRPALCESIPVADRPIATRPESYVTMVSRNKGGNAEEEDDEDRIYGKLEDADPSWSLQSQQLKRMAIAQINANEQLEDRGVLQQLHTVCNGDLLLAGVMDGHGGWQVADYVQRKIGAYIERSINKMAASKADCTTPLTDVELAKAMKEAFVILDRDIMTKVKGTCDIGLSRNARVGACCVVALVTESSVVVANAGDCRAVIDDKGNAHALSESHSANEEEERSRLKREHPGEDDIVVCKRTYEVERPPRSWLEYPRFWLGVLGNEIRLSGCYVKGRLQPTRSFGDFYLKMKEFAYDFESNRPFVKNGDSFPYITAEPTTSIFPRIKNNGQFILLASDGVWDFLTPSEAIEVARTGLETSPQTAAASVIQTVLRKATVEAGVTLAQIAVMPPKQKRRVYDDTTVCIVNLDSV